MPAPSPVLASQPHAPRWSRFTRIFKASDTSLVGLFALHVDDEPQPARIVLELRIVKALFRRRTQLHLTIVISFWHCLAGGRGWISPRPLIFYSNFTAAQ